LKPGGKVGLHAHPEHLLYLLTDATLAIAQQGKTPYEMTFKAGEALILPAQIQSTENTGDKSVRALVVEIKSAVTPPAPARKGRIRKPRRG
ncbi:MAG: hypothetical protein J0H62_02695, partial [Rhizobiales bacterium]|nr:hypothetical protein [Hyphomicrobiales bacterium]